MLQEQSEEQRRASEEALGAHSEMVRKLQQELESQKGSAAQTVRKLEEEPLDIVHIPSIIIFMYS